MQMHPREADELTLQMLRMVDDGLTMTETAKRLGVGKGKVIGALRSVREEDTAA